VSLPDPTAAILTQGPNPKTRQAQSTGNQNPKTDPFRSEYFLPLALTPEQTALMLNTSTVTLRLWRRRGYGPRFTKINRKIRYMTAELEKWLADQMADPEFYRAELEANPKRREMQLRMAYANSFRECMKRKRRSAA
jgi:hypothetical protein